MALHSTRCHGHMLLVPAALSVTACALYFPSTPILPRTFEGPLSASADSLVASTQLVHCAPTRHLDFGTTPQGCERVAGDTIGWVNWTGLNHVVKVGREWSLPDGVTALRVGRSMEGELAGRLGPPVECHYKHQPSGREVRWITTEPAGISTALIVLDSLPGPTPLGGIVVMRTLGPERCGFHVDRPWTH
jgi:hypothetical protein